MRVKNLKNSIKAEFIGKDFFCIHVWEYFISCTGIFMGYLAYSAYFVKEKNININ